MSSKAPSLDIRDSPGTTSTTHTAVPDPRAAFWASFFGGRNVRIGPRIAPLPDYLRDELSEESALAFESAGDAILSSQLAKEDGSAIRYRSCSWQKTAGLLFSEYICLAVMSFPWSYSVLGLVPGVLFTIFVAVVVQYTSLVLWELCLRHPEVRDACDIAEILFWGRKWVWWATAAMFVLNNTFIQALHVLVGAEYLNTMISSSSLLHNGTCRTVVLSVAVTALSWLVSLPRTFSMLSRLATATAFFTFISLLLATVFSAVQGRPAGFSEQLGEPVVTAFPVKGTTFVQGMAAFLNISYTLLGQLSLPSFIAEMRDARDFPKALWACTIAQIIIYSVVGGVIYAYTGNQYVTAPAFGSLHDKYKKVSFSFMVPTLIFLGCLYASVTARFVFFRIFRNTRHLNNHTLVGWTSWAGILLVTWVLAFVISQVIPFFNSLLSIMSSVFDSWFGFIFWGVAYMRMRSADQAAGIERNQARDRVGMVVNTFIILIGVYVLTVGTYASVEGVIDFFRAGNVKGVFSCRSNAI